MFCFFPFQQSEKELFMGLPDMVTIPHGYSCYCLILVILHIAMDITV